MEEGKARFNNISVTMFGHLVLFGCMRGCGVVGDAMSGEEWF